MSQITRHYRDIKKGLRKSNPVDPYFISKYSFSPYMACQHACKYCDGRAEKYFVEGDYELDIVIRKNLPEILKAELPKLREKGIISIGSGISDPYQQVENSERLMQKCAEILLEYPYSVTILTKSALVQRDLSIWKEINQKNGVLLMLSITTLDDRIRKIFEPFASSIEERLETLSSFTWEGIPVGVLAMPFLPGITDSESSINSLVKELTSRGVKFIMPGHLTLRPGVQKETYINVIKQRYPDLLEKYQQLYSNMLPSGNPVISYRKKVSARYREILLNNNIPLQIPHSIYHGRLNLPDEIYVLLEHMHHLYELRNVDTSRLRKSFNAYSVWLKEKRSYYLRRRNLPEKFLTEKLLEGFYNGNLAEIISNPKLFKFLKETVEKGKIFNYNKLTFD